MKNLPHGLNETYARILRKITDQHQLEAIKVFKWLSASKYPLTLTEICEAIAIKSSDTYFGQIESRLPNDSLKLVQSCGDLVIINKQDQIVQFIHSTVLEFLRSFWTGINYQDYYINVSKANLELGERCITYLALADFETQIATNNPTPKPEIMSQKYRLLNYTRLNWLHHCISLSTEDERTWMLFENLVYKKTLPFQHLPWVDGESSEDLPALPLFQWAIENNHVALLNSLISQLGSTHIHQ